MPRITYSTSVSLNPKSASVVFLLDIIRCCRFGASAPVSFSFLLPLYLSFLCIINDGVFLEIKNITSPSLLFKQL